MWRRGEDGVVEVCGGRAGCSSQLPPDPTQSIHVYNSHTIYPHPHPHPHTHTHTHTHTYTHTQLTRMVMSVEAVMMELHSADESSLNGSTQVTGPSCPDSTHSLWPV